MINHPARLGKYEIDGVLGFGGMGVVYRAFDPTAQRTVALKIIRKDLLWQDCVALAARLRHEAHAAARLDHPGIVAVYEYGEDGDVALIAMELVDGCTLFDCLHEDVPLPITDVVSVTAQLLDALRYAHEQGIVHRDIKPANIMLTRDGRLKLADFGVACADASNLPRFDASTGTPSYMAPEQIRGRGSDVRSDLFSAGVLFHEMLTGVNPFSGTAAAMAHRICNEPMRPLYETAPDIPNEFDPLIAKALAKDPDDRFQTAAQFSKALKGVCERTLSVWPVPEVSNATLWRASLRKQAASAPTLPGACAPGRDVSCSQPTAPQPAASGANHDPDDSTAYNIGYAADDCTAYNTERDTDSEPRRAAAQCAAAVGAEFDGVTAKALAAAPRDRFPTAVRYSFAAQSAHEDTPRAGDEAVAPRAAPPPESSREPAPYASASTELIPRLARNALVAWSSPLPADAIEAAEHHLTIFIGPIAKYCVRQAAALAADLDQLYARLAEQLETEEMRRDFLSHRPAKSHASNLSAPLHYAALAEVDTLPPALVEAVASQLAQFVGPIARLLAKRAVRRASDASELYAILAEELSDAERAAFLRHAPHQT